MANESLNKGRYNISDKKRTTESQHRIDIRFLRKKGWLRPGISGKLYWTYNGKSTGSINFLIGYDCLVISYSYRLNCGEWEEVIETVYFEWTPCNFGGYRYWFLCPNCNRRVALLYGAGKYFLCRKCHKLAYGSQQETKAYRMLRKARNIRRRLGANESLRYPVNTKPKNMHWKTFDKLRFLVMEYETNFYRIISKKPEKKNI